MDSNTRFITWTYSPRADLNTTKDGYKMNDPSSDVKLTAVYNMDLRTTYYC